MGDTTSEVHTSSADLLLALIPGYGELRHANLDDFGGETALLNHATQERVDMLAATVSLCSAWRSLADPVAAATFIENAAAELDVSELIDFNDVVLAAPAALPALATGLARVWRRLATNNQTLLGNVALEGWTRLALGGWCGSTLPIRGTMSTRGSNAVDGETEADIFLVRSIASAAEAWAEPDLVSVLEGLTEVGDVEPDAAFELGMLDLRAAVEATDMDNAIAALGAAIKNFNRACIEGDRPDAVAFRTASEAVRDFASGRTVSANLADAVQRAVTDWLHGYLGEDRHWRQTRSDTAPQWAALVRDLAAVADLDEPVWYDTAALLADVGRIYVAYNSNTLLANPTSGAVPPRSSPQGPTPTPTPAIVAPRLDAGLAAAADKLRLVDRWLTAKATNTRIAADADAFAAISEARERLRVTPPDPPAPPGKSDASRDALPEDVREALKDLLTSGDFDDIAAFALAADASAVPPQPLEIAHGTVRNRLLGELKAIRPDAYELWELQLAGIVETYVRHVAFTINQQQGGARNLPWHKVIDDTSSNKRPAEHYLADHLHSWFTAAGYDATVEGANIGGGRADVVIRVGVERFVIEVKRISVTRTNDDLSADFGPQAQQYTMTAAPFAFLAVLDNKARTSRIELDASMWTSLWTNAESDVAHALAAARVLADVQPPSAQPSTRK